MRRRVALALAAAGLALAAWQWGGAAWLGTKAVLAQHLLERAWAESRAGDRQQPPWPWADFSPVARLRVEALGVTRIVLSDASARTLAFGPGHLPNSALPGQPGTVVLAGHRDTHFRFLKRLRRGMTVELVGRHRVTRYRVTGTRVLDTQSERLSLTAPGRLVLVTCWPFDALTTGGPLRYLVVTERVPEADGRAI